MRERQSLANSSALRAAMAALLREAAKEQGTVPPTARRKRKG